MALDVPQTFNALLQGEGLNDPAEQLLIFAGWALVVGRSCYMWSVLTLFVVWLAWRRPILTEKRDLAPAPGQAFTFFGSVITNLGLKLETESPEELGNGMRRSMASDRCDGSDHQRS